MANSKKNTGGTALVIVESPAKAKTINRYLGSAYKVMASMGHVRDLPPNDLGVDLTDRFTPVYQILDNKRKVVEQLRTAARKFDRVFLATDLDREGEAIAWHLVHALELDPKSTHRVVFNEITKSAIDAAFASAHELDMDKVNAQQARRVLDRIVGYQLSPLLQAKIARGLSAGRVQSVAVRLIVAREQQIRSFVPEESWRILACFATRSADVAAQAASWETFLARGKENGPGPTVKARNAWLSKHGCLYAELISVGGDEFAAKELAEATAVAESLGFVTERVDESELEGHADKGLKRFVLDGRTDRDKAPSFTVTDVQRRRTQSKPSPPFTTAALQQAASSALGFAPSRTMRIAQQLYEGVDLGDAAGPVGLITYMRTDSTHLSAESVKAVRSLVGGEYGDAYLPKKPNVYASKKRAQEAHEAIRASDPLRTPQSLQKKLSGPQFKLYDLIWRRFVACQMTPAAWDNTTVLIGAKTSKGEAVFRATGRKLVFDGFLRVSGIPANGDVILPEIETSQPVHPLQIEPRQQFTSPPPRYSEASLVKKLEAEGIGRPSTYAAIIQTIQDRSYVDLIDKRLHPTARGEMVTEKLVKHFPKVMDVKFTSYMEEELDKIEEAHLDWVHVLEEFYGPFKEDYDRAQLEMQRVRAEPSDHVCPTCGKPMVYRFGKNGRFLSCKGYPECTTSRNIDGNGDPIDDVVAEEPCVRCGKPMVLKSSRLGPFLGCSGYPDCTNTVPSDEHGVPLKIVKPEEINESCDECRRPMAVKFARGRSFLGCSGYPECKATKPIPPGLYVEKPKPQDAGVGCDKCGRPMVIRKSRRGPFLSCSGFPRCRNAMPMEKLDHLKELAAAGKIPDPPPESANGAGRNGRSRRQPVKVDIKALGPPPEGFAWTRTGRPVVETWPDGPLTCPDCGKAVPLKSGRFGPYFSCSAYPKCKFTANLRGEAKKRAAVEMPMPEKPKPVPTDIACSECGKPMLIRTGRTGPFLGCSGYPKCRHSEPLPEGVAAPEPANPA
ncbi:MAG: type I DNA topoisomerase [Phycisphaerae bacterium]